MKNRSRKKAVRVTASPALTVSSNTQTTLRLPTRLYKRAKSLAGPSGARSINDFIVNALEVYMKALERKRIDDAFSPMADDDDYQRESMKLAEQFVASDLESLLLSEKELVAR